MKHELLPKQILGRMSPANQEYMLRKDAELESEALSAGANYTQRACHNPHADEPDHFSLKAFANGSLVFDRQYK